MCHGDATYHLHEDRGDELIYYGHSDAIDLTRQPHLWNVPPATTMFG